MVPPPHTTKNQTAEIFASKIATSNVVMWQ